MDGDSNKGDTTLSQNLGKKIEQPARDALSKVADAFQSVKDGSLGPDITNIVGSLAAVSKRAGPEIMDTAFAASLADLTGSGWGGKLIFGIAGYFLQKKGFLGFLDNTETGQALKAGVVGLSLLKNGNDVLAKMGVPGTDLIKKGFDYVPGLAVAGGVAALGYTLFKPALDQLGDKATSAMRDGSFLGMKPQEAPH